MVNELSPSETLTNVLTINERAAQQMLSQCYVEAFETFSTALVIAKQGLALAYSSDQDDLHVVAIEPGVSWEGFLGTNSCPTENPTCFVFRRPVILRLAPECGHQKDDELESLLWNHT